MRILGRTPRRRLLLADDRGGVTHRWAHAASGEFAVRRQALARTCCLIEAALRCQIEILLPCAMSNHHHTVIYDRWGRYPEFVEHFHKMLARSQNALRERWENFWSSEQVCAVKLVDRAAVIDKLVYTAPTRSRTSWSIGCTIGRASTALAPCWAGVPCARRGLCTSFAPTARCPKSSSCG